MWAKRIEEVSIDIMNQIRLYKGQNNGVLIYNPFSDCASFDKDDIFVKYNTNLFVARKKYKDYIYYKPSTFCQEYCLSLQISDYVGNDFEPTALLPAFGYDSINNHIVIKDMMVISTDPCLKDNMNDPSCSYLRVPRVKTTLLYDSIKQICPPDDVCTYYKDNGEFFANQVVSSEQFTNYFLSNFIKVIDTIESIAEKHNTNQYLLTAGFFIGNMVLFALIYLLKNRYTTYKKKKKINMLKIGSTNPQEMQPLQCTEVPSSRYRNKEARKIILDMEKIASAE